MIGFVFNIFLCIHIYNSIFRPSNVAWSTAKFLNLPIQRWHFNHLCIPLIRKLTEWVQPLTRPIKMNDTALNWMPACMNHAKRLAISTFPRPIASYWNYHKCLLIYCDDCAVLLRCLPIYRFFLIMSTDQLHWILIGRGPTAQEMPWLDMTELRYACLPIYVHVTD